MATNAAGDQSEPVIDFPASGAIAAQSEPVIDFPSTRAASVALEGVPVDFPKSNSPANSADFQIGYPRSNSLGGDGDTILVVIGKFVVGEQNVAGIVNGTKQLAQINGKTVINGDY